MPIAPLLTGAVSVLIGLLYLAEDLQYSLGTLARPGPGFYPLIVGTLMVIAGVGIGLEGVWQRPQGGIPWPAGRARWRVLAIVMANGIYIFLLPFLGHPVLCTILNLVVLQVMGLTGWPLKIGLALTLGFGSHYLFKILLDVPLPGGTWF